MSCKLENSLCATEIWGPWNQRPRSLHQALRLRWEWFRWTEQERPWVETDTPCDEADKDLFAACTTILIGNGETARFWSDRWLDGEAPQHLAPLCFALATRKKLSVQQALHRGSWMGGLQHIENEEQLGQFINLWTKLQLVTLQPHIKDLIT
jgi:hypothetical protein